MTPPEASPGLVIPLVAAITVHAAILLGPGLPIVEPPSMTVDAGASSVELVFVEPAAHLDQPVPQAHEEQNAMPHAVPEFQSSQPPAVPIINERLALRDESLSTPRPESEELELPDIPLAEESMPEQSMRPEQLVPSVESSGVEAQNLEPTIGNPLEVQYPSLARRRGQEGIVVVRIHVDASGVAKDVELLESSTFSQLDNAVIRAVKHHRFEPARIEDIPVNGTLDFRVRFRLE